VWCQQEAAEEAAGTLGWPAGADPAAVTGGLGGAGGLEEQASPV